MQDQTASTHRPFDGGVQLGTGSPSHGAQAIRQSKKYIRYQSVKVSCIPLVLCLHLLMT